MKLRNKVLIGIALMIASFGGAEVWSYYAPGPNRGRLQTALNIKKLPESAAEVSCPPSSIVTDLVIDCTLVIAEADFRHLLQGWPFFEAGKGVYVAKPPSFEHGGEVSVTIDDARRKVRVSYYEE
jgi:hypothetical protein